MAIMFPHDVAVLTGSPKSLIAIVTLLALAVYLVQVLTKPKKLPLPPGPKGLPIVGNVRDLPPKGTVEWKHWLKHKDTYGPISSVTVLGKTIVLVHDLEIATELLTKRSAKYSMRPSTPMMNLVGVTEFIAGAKGKDFRTHRKLAALQLGNKPAAERFFPAMEVESRRFLMRALNDPNNLVNNLRGYSAGIMLRMLYGYEPSRHRVPDPLIGIIEKTMDGFVRASSPGAWPVDFLPFLLHLPVWAPGAAFKRFGQACRQNTIRSLHIPVAFVQQQLNRGSARNSYVSRLLLDSDEAGLTPEEKKLIASSAASLFGGGAETTAATLTWFFCAMARYPEVQARAQKEIDEVLAKDGRLLPAPKDRENLPYCTALGMEVSRWQSISPMGLPHVVSEDDEFEGYRIPKGAMVFASASWFGNNPAIYKDPAEFRPERFLGPNPEPNAFDSFVFGFGRRVCPGRLIAVGNVHNIITKTLAVFNITKVIDEVTGQVIEPVALQSPGTGSHPEPFRCNIVPRSERHADVVRSLAKEDLWGDGDADALTELFEAEAAHCR
ncbi:unnamed protein product [Discula destructiva]